MTVAKSRRHPLQHRRKPIAAGKPRPRTVPFANGGNGAPIANGGNGAPFTNGGNGAPIANGSNGAPFTNGDNGAPIANGVNGRDDQGRFAKGNPGGPGNPFTRQVAALRKAFMDAVTTDDLHVLTRLLLTRAVQGDLAAAKLVYLYSIGKPVAPVDPDTLDLHEWKIFEQTPVGNREFMAVMSALPVEMACDIIRKFGPMLTQEKYDKLDQKLGERQQQKKKRRARMGAR